MSRRANKRNRKKFLPSRKEDFFLFRAERVGETDMGERIPELQALRDKKVAVIGLGNLGAPSAIEFAKAGVGELRIIDYDIVEGGTIVRWPFGLSAVGLGKVDCIKDFIAKNFPYTNVVPEIHRLGSTEQRVDGRTELEILNNFFVGIDLVFDATAEYGIQHFLADLCQANKIPYVCISTTFGIWGGRIYRIAPGKTEGCWVCLQIFRDKNKDWVPIADPKGEVHPKGCAAPTFTGANFDSLQISSAGVRLAVATLCAGVSDGYPNFDWDVGVVDFRDVNGQAIAPNWRTFQLKKHPECKRCNP
ncbi:MAG: ThiF family adenylyltransferase [Thermodesulfovibrionales bacterium]